MTTLALAAMVCPHLPHCQAAVEAWVQRYNYFADSDDRASKVVTDSDGNIIVAGSTDERITGQDMLIIKYSSEGEALWTNRYNGLGNGNDEASAVAVDSSGNVFVTGSSSDADGYYDYATIKYSNAGVALWTNRYNGPQSSHDSASAVAVDGSGNVFVTGYSYGSASSRDYATIAYSSAGVALWTNRYNGPGNGDDAATALAVDSSGNVFVTGYSARTSVGDDYDYATMKYSNAGVALWTNRYDGPANGNDIAQAVAVDGDGNAFVIGDSAVGYGIYDYATIAYSGAGVALWTNRYDSGSGNDQAKSVAVDGSGNVIVTGYSSYSSYDYATIKYSNVGVALWTNLYDGPANGGNDIAQAVAVDGSGNVFVTGYSYGSDSVIPDYATIAYSSAGVALWTNRYNGPGNGDDAAAALAVDASGNVFVTGQSIGSGSSYDYATIKYSGAGVAMWTNRYDGLGNVNEQANAVAVSGSGNVFVTGSSAIGFGSVDDYATIGYSSAGVVLWTNRYNGPGNGDDDATAVAVDGSGKVFVTGNSTGSGSGYDYATIAYSEAGMPLWTNRYDGPGHGTDRATDVALGGSGNVLVTGYSTTIGGTFDYATVAYSGAGVPLWTNRYSGPGNNIDRANSVAVDSSGNVFVTGESIGSGTFFDFATIAYSSTGVPLWTNRYNGPGNIDDKANAVVVEGSGNVLVTGFSFSFGSGYDYATIKYSGAGVALWTNRYNGPAGGDDRATAVAVDSSGNVFVTGVSAGSGGGGNDYATIAYSGAGVALWTNRYNGSGNGDDRATAVAVDFSGNAIVTGASASIGVYPYNYNFATIAYSSAGVALWTNCYNGPANGNDLPQTKKSLSVGPDGSVYVTGTSDRGYTFSNTPDFATVKYEVAPTLKIAQTPTNAVALSWLSAWTEFTLQQNTNSITTVNWSNVVATPSDDGTNKTVIVNPPVGNAFYRLKSP